MFVESSDLPCSTEYTHKGITVVAAGIPIVLFDALIFALTVMRARKLSHSFRILERISERKPLASIMLEDGCFYFLYVIHTHFFPSS